MTTQMATHLQPIHLGHHNIQNDQVRLLFFNDVECLFTIFGNGNIIAIKGEGAAQRVPYSLLIIYYNNFHIYNYAPSALRN